MKKLAVLLLGVFSLTTSIESFAGTMYRQPLEGVTCVKKVETKYSYKSEGKDSFFTYKGSSYSGGIYWNGNLVSSTMGLKSVTLTENGTKYIYSAGNRIEGHKACSGCYGATTYYYEVIKKVAEERPDTNYCAF